MKTYEQILKHIKVNKHLYEHEVSWTQAGKLDAKLEVVSSIYEVPLVKVINDYSDTK
jgi:hypothetical protein